MTLVRNFVGVTAYGYAARKVVVDASLQAARTRDDLPDIINVAPREFSEKRRNLLVTIAIGRQRKIRSRPQEP